MSVFDRERQYLERLQLEYLAQKQRFPWVNPEISRQIAASKARLYFYESARDELFSLARAKGDLIYDKALNLWTIKFSDSGDMEESLTRYRDSAVGLGYMDSDLAYKVELHFIDPEQQKKRQAESEEFQKLKSAQGIILQAVGREKENDAQRIYNRWTDRPLDWKKLDMWCEHLCSAGLLGKEWTLGAQVGVSQYKMVGSVKKLSNKMIGKHLENKT